MSRIGETDFDVIRGDTFRQQLTFLDAAGAALDVSTYTFSGQVRTDPDDTVVLGAFTFDATAAATGIVTVTLSATVTATLAGPFVHYDIQYTAAGIVTTAPRGRLKVIKDVTR